MHYTDSGTVAIEDDDQCALCDNFKKDVACPLLQALALGYVYLEGSLTVTNCGFFKPYVRHLNIVKNNQQT